MQSKVAMIKPKHIQHERHDSTISNNGDGDIAHENIYKKPPEIITTAPELPSTDLISSMEELTIACERALEELQAGVSDTTQPSSSKPTPTPTITSVESLTQAEILDITHPEFDLWCKQNNTSPISLGAFDDFLTQATLIPSPEDPPAYPGYTHAVTLYAYTSAGEFTPSSFAKERIKRLILQNLGLVFEVGTTIDRRWEITKELVGVEGYYNQGIFLVRGKDTSDDVRIMKLLPTQIMHPNFAAREIDILRRLNHPNIITFLDGKTSLDPTGPNYLVTNYCNAGTLSNLLEYFNEEGVLVPELFLWHIFESLVSAVQYIHHGPDTPRRHPSATPPPVLPAPWDEIHHRDIIPGNIFLSHSTSPSSYPHVSLADFGCAVSAEELSNTELDLYDLPVEDADYIPPEGPVPSEAADIYHVGLVLSCFYGGGEAPIREVGDLCREEVRGFKAYSSELRMFLEVCLDEDEEERMCVKELLEGLRRSRGMLERGGKLVFEGLGEGWWVDLQED